MAKKRGRAENTTGQPEDDFEEKFEANSSENENKNDGDRKIQNQIQQQLKNIADHPVYGHGHILQRKSNIQNQSEVDNRGVVYISRIPPGVGPRKILSLLDQYGEISRIYFEKEEKSRKHNANKQNRFSDGWIEFADKEIARNVAESLNNTPMAKKKGDYLGSDLWNLRYLRKFRWKHLTEKLAYQQQLRAERLRAELEEAKKENEEFMEQVKRTRIAEKIQQKKRKRIEQKEKKEGESETSTPLESFPTQAPRIMHQFTPNVEPSEDLDGVVDDSVLLKVFRKKK